MLIKEAALALLLALSAPAGAAPLVGARAPGSGSGFGGARFAPLSRSWDDAFSFTFSNSTRKLGRGAFLSVFGSEPRYKTEQSRVYEPLVWALAQKQHDPLSFIQLGEEAQAEALHEAAELASKELTFQAHAALETFLSERTDAGTLESTVRSMDAVHLLWSQYLPKDLRPALARAYFDARLKVQTLKAGQVGDALEKISSELDASPKDAVAPADDEGLAKSLTGHLLERLRSASQGASKAPAEEIVWTAEHFDDEGVNRTLALELVEIVKTWKDDHARAMHAAEALKKLVIRGYVPPDLHEPLLRTLLSLEYPSSSLYLREELIRTVSNIGEKTKDAKVRDAAYRAIVREWLGPNRGREEDFDHMLGVRKEEWDARMGGLPKPATVKRYRELWAVKDAGDLWELADRASAIKRLEKKHPALIHHLQIPLTPPVSEKTASEADVKNAKPLDPPKFSLN